MIVLVLIMYFEGPVNFPITCSDLRVATVLICDSLMAAVTQKSTR
jgi:hypothetical protein